MKPVVTYAHAEGEQYIGIPALLFGVKGHPFVNGQGFVRTSRVIRLSGGGEFETMNTIYRKETA